MNIECPRCEGKGIVKKIPKKIKKDELPYHLDIVSFVMEMEKLIGFKELLEKDH